MPRRTFKARKLLVASIGAASVSYVACSSGNGSSSVFDAGPITDATQLDELVVGNLGPSPMIDSGPVDSSCVAKECIPGDAGLDASTDAAVDAPSDAIADAPEGG